MSSSLPLTQGPCITDENEDLIYLKLFEDVIDYPSDPDTPLDTLNAVVSVSKTVGKQPKNENHANDEAKSITQQNVSSLRRNGSQISQTGSSSLNLDSKSGDTASNNESLGTESYNIDQAGLSIESNQDNLGTGDVHIDPATWEDFLQWLANQNSIDLDIEDHNNGGGDGNGLVTQTRIISQSSSEYEQIKENVKIIGDCNINNNSIIPAQTQTLANIQWSHQYVCDNGSGKYYNQSGGQMYDAQSSVAWQERATGHRKIVTDASYERHSGNEVRYDNAYYQTEFIPGSSKGNLDPSFLPHPNYANEGRISRASQMPEDLSLPRNQKTPSTIIGLQPIPSNLFNYMPPTRSKRQREDDVITQPRKRQTQPPLPSIPIPPQSIPPMWGVIPPRPFVQPSSGMNVPLSLEKHRMSLEVLAASHMVTCKKKDERESRDEEGGDDNKCEEEREEGDGAKESEKYGSDEDAEGEVCGEDDYEEDIYV